MAKAKSPTGTKRKAETSVNIPSTENSSVAAERTLAQSEAAVQQSAPQQLPTPQPHTPQQHTAPVAEATPPQQPAGPQKTNGSRETSKLAVMKNESRATVTPINLEDEIRRRAYELSERRGFASGYETEDWLAAESEVLRRYRQQSA